MFDNAIDFTVLLLVYRLILSQIHVWVFGTPLIACCSRNYHMRSRRLINYFPTRWMDGWDPLSKFYIYQNNRCFMNLILSNTEQSLLWWIFGDHQWLLLKVNTFKAYLSMSLFFRPDGDEDPAAYPQDSGKFPQCPHATIPCGQVTTKWQKKRQKNR